MAEEIGSVEMLRSDFINNFSHEFKTPISSIQGFAEMLKLDDLTQEERGIYSDNHRGSFSPYGAGLEYSEPLQNRTAKHPHGAYPVECQRTNSSGYCAPGQRWSAKDITVAFDCGEHFVVGNKELLKQVWINLADNAIKFSPEHETVEISIRETPAALVISFCEQRR